ncbi:MAG: hypothetical protein V5B44_11665 [Candidatus Accumulibacter necessarius]|uniref:hypothetical protein n=1 Tax=Candidatus Accumulibacter necessarius TaxID=2954386 RepID=UPI002FC27E14
MINGISGVGMTRLALEYAWRRADDYGAMFFASADDPVALQSNFAVLCGRRILDLPEQRETEEARQHDAVLKWLCEHPGWLMMFDNVDSEEAAAAAESLLPQLAGGHTLLNSGPANWSAAAWRFCGSMSSHPRPPPTSCSRARGQTPRSRRRCSCGANAGRRTPLPRFGARTGGRLYRAARAELRAVFRRMAGSTRRGARLV